MTWDQIGSNPADTTFSVKCPWGKRRCTHCNELNPIWNFICSKCKWDFGIKEKPKDEDGVTWTKLAEFYKFSSVQIIKKEKKIDLVFIEVQKIRYYIEEDFIVKKIAKT